MEQDYSDSTALAVVLTVAGMLPPIIFFALMGKILSDFVIVSSIEDMKNHELIASTVRLMKTQRALLVLKVLAKLRGMGSRTSRQRRQSRKASSVSSLGGSIVGTDSEAKEESERPEMRIHDPVDTSHIDLPEEVSNLMHHLAEVNHDDWCKAKRAQGWVYGEKRDNEKKVHPDLVSFSQLGSGGQKYNLDSSAETLKVILALGYNMHKKVERRKSVVARSSAQSSKDFEKLSDMLASNTHQKWAKDKIEAGWVYGEKLDGTLKTHDLLVPYADLNDDHKRMNHAAAEASLKTIRKLGYVFERKSSLRRQKSSNKSGAKPPSMGTIPEDASNSGGKLGEVDRNRASTVQIKRKDIHRVFAMFDKEKHGALHNVDILPALSTLGWAVSATDAVQIICEMDPTNSGEVAYEAFESWVVDHEDSVAEESTEDLATSIFNYIDEDNSGHVTAQELYEAVRGLGEEIDMEDAQEIVKSADHDGNGSIDLSEFTKLMKSVLKGQ